MRRPRPRSFAMLALASLITTGVGAQSNDRTFVDARTPGTPQREASGTIRHVANVAYDLGTDLEFIRRRVMVEGQEVPREYAVLGRLGRPVKIVDITDPEHPDPVANIPCRLNQNDVQIQGSIAVLAADVTSTCRFPGEGDVAFRGFATVDLSDPRDPRVLGRAVIARGAHNLTLHPSAPVVYVSDADLTGTGVLHVWDISDPAAPALVTDLLYHPGHSPHDITFTTDGSRTFAASITHIDVFDTTDPRAPRLLHTLVDPAINIAHQADPTPDGRFLIVSDELAGAAAGVVCPGGGLHVYDISNPLTLPVKVGTFWADDLGPGGVCTAHVFRINPDGETMAIAWYNAGVHVIDFGDLLTLGAGGSGALTGVGVRTIAAMKLPNADTWSAKMWQRRHPGYVFANDLNRGFDVYFVPALA